MGCCGLSVWTPIAEELLEDISHVVDHEEMALARKESRIAIRDPLCLMPAHRWRYWDVRFPLPEVNRDVYFR